MEKALFVVPLADLERGPKEVTWSLSEPWLRRALEGTDATPRAEGSLQVQLTKTGREVMVRGELRAPLSMPCVRTLEPVDVDLTSDVFLLLRQGETPRSEERPAGRAAKAEARPRGEGGKRKASGWRDDAELSLEEAAQDTFVGEKVELDRFIREFILLELPMMPMQKGLREEPEPAIARSPDNAEATVDPRLAPLAAIASRMRQNKE